MIHTKGHYRVSNCIYQSKNSVIYSAVDTVSNRQVVLKTANTSLFDTHHVARLKNEYTQLSKIKSDHVPAVLDFVALENEYYIVLAYCEGVSLSDYIGERSIPIKEFLQIALDIVRGLSDIHAAGIIHKDINPANIMFNRTRRRATIVDFGISTQFSYEKPQALDQTASEGTLWYISPEQTGRMNRAVDFRTDFYSLGVTFYQMLCGCLPFDMQNPAELIYAHIAKRPHSLEKLRPDTPLMLARLILKLMAKMPEDRYLSAEGIEADLQICARAYTGTGTIPEFQLGLKDYSPTFEIPQKVYGREKEIGELIEAYQAVVDGGKALVAIGGHSGVGKTALAGEMQRYVVNHNGVFHSGKHELYRVSVPYVAFIEAVESFCESAICESDAIVRKWKERISLALGDDSAVLIEKIPRLRLLLGGEYQKRQLSPVEESAIFKGALRNMIACIAYEKPLVLFIDDIHIADIGSLEMLSDLMLSDDIGGLLLMCGFRNNEVDENHPFMLRLSSLASRKADIRVLTLYGLSMAATADLIADALRQQLQNVVALSEIVYGKTHGNPFYIRQFLRLCHMNGLITFNIAERTWQWEQAQIEESPAEENVVNYLIRNIGQIPEETARMLSLGAAVGQRFSLHTVCMLSNRGIKHTISALKRAVDYKIIYYVQGKTNREDNSLFQFTHDKYRQAFYTVLKADERSAVHYALAEYYEKSGELSGEADERFIIADHYCKAFSSLSDPAQKRRVCEILLSAAHALTHLASYDTAARLLTQVIEDDKLHTYGRDFEYSVFAEYHAVLCAMARYEEADTLYARLESFHTHPLLLTDTCCLQAVGLSNRGQYKKAFELGIGLLKQLGVCFPQKNLTRVVTGTIDKYYDAITEGSIIPIDGTNPVLVQRESAIGKILNRITAAGFFYDPMYSYWAIITNARRVLEYGYTPDGLQLYADLPLILISFRNDYKTSCAAAQKALQLAERYGYRHELYRIYHVYSLFCNHWIADLRQSIPYARESHGGNAACGDFEFACYSYYTTQMAMLETAQSLTEFNSEVQTALAFAHKTGNRHAVDAYVSFRQFHAAMSTKTACPGSFDNEPFSETAHVNSIGQNTMALCYFYILRALSATLYCEYDTAYALCEKAQPLLGAITGFYPTALHNFLHSLGMVKQLEKQTCSEPEKAVLLERLQANQRWLKARAADAPVNFSHLHMIIKAEIAAISDEKAGVLQLYEEAIAAAAANDRPYHYALICELAAQRFFNRRAQRAAESFLREAYYAYLSWEASEKVEQLRHMYQEALVGDHSSRRAYSVPKGFRVSSDRGATLSSIDYNSFIKASQAISSEMQSDAILQTLMGVLLENTGAQDIYYLTKEGGSLCIQAQAHAEGDTCSIKPQPAHAGLISMKIVRYVERARESVVLDNAAISASFGMDEHVRAHHTKSVMCIPVLHKNDLKGILYLENNLIAGAFDKRRTLALNAIASQLAISLENAYLYNNLQQLIDERTSELREEIVMRRQTEQRLERMANYDSLTDLPNRRRFFEYLEDSIRLAKQKRAPLAVLFVDLDGFKGINDQFGHDKGDFVLVTTAKRLIRAVRDGDMVGRLGGDEFVLIVENARNIRQIQKVCDRIIKNVSKTIALRETGVRVTVTVSIGVSMLYADGDTAEQLITNADRAMYEAKNNGKNQFAFYHTVLENNA